MCTTDIVEIKNKTKPNNADSTSNNVCAIACQLTTISVTLSGVMQHLDPLCLDHYDPYHSKLNCFKPLTNTYIYQATTCH